MDKSQNYYTELSKKHSGKDKTRSQKSGCQSLGVGGGDGLQKGSTREFLCDGNQTYIWLWCLQDSAFLKYIDGTTKWWILLNKIIPQ